MNVLLLVVRPKSLEDEEYVREDWHIVAFGQHDWSS